MYVANFADNFGLSVKSVNSGLAVQYSRLLKLHVMIPQLNLRVSLAKTETALKLHISKQGVTLT